MNEHETILKQKGYNDTHIKRLNILPEEILNQFYLHLSFFQKQRWQPETTIFFLEEIAETVTPLDDLDLRGIINRTYKEPYRLFFTRLEEEKKYSKRHIEELKKLPWHFSIILDRGLALFTQREFTFSEILSSFASTLVLSVDKDIQPEKQLKHLIKELRISESIFDKKNYIRKTLTDCLKLIFKRKSDESFALAVKKFVDYTIENDISYETLWLLKERFLSKEPYSYMAIFGLQQEKIKALFNYLIPLRESLHFTDKSIFSIVSLDTGERRIEDILQYKKIFEAHFLPRQQIMELFGARVYDPTFYSPHVLAAALLLNISPDDPEYPAWQSKQSDAPSPPMKKAAAQICFFTLPEHPSGSPDPDIQSPSPFV